ncbi:MAG: GNAT family N-acetyltransferase [Thermodesulfovibrionales bacterium]
MQVDIITRSEDFEKIRKNWSEVYASDTEATIFASWEWQRGWMEITPYSWSVLALRQRGASSYRSFLPLGMHAVRRGRLKVFRKLVIGGEPWADNTGFVCAPGYAESDLATFARFVQKKMRWNAFALWHVADRRLDSFLVHFPGGLFRVHEVGRVPCPRILLPDTWEQYLRDFLSTATRKDLKYHMRKVEGLRDFRVTHAEKGTLEEHIGTLLTLWKARWGRERADELPRIRTLLRRCFEGNSLLLPVLWNGKEPLAGAAAFLDRRTGTFTGYIMGFNEAFAKLSPGRVMVGYCIRYAVENGFRVFDFGAGREEYKLSFGVTERFNRNVVIRRESLPSRLRRSMPEPLKRVVKRWGGA